MLLACLLAQDLLRMDVEGLLAAAQPEPSERVFLVGPAGGYVRTRENEEGAWYAGAFARLRLGPSWGAEAAVSAYRHEYRGDDIQVLQVPAQLSALYYPFREDLLRPYLMGGAGWYATRVSFKDSLEALDDEDEQLFGLHLGGGGEMQMGTAFKATIDFRYVFMQEPDLDTNALDDVDFDLWQVAIGFGFLF